MEHLNILLSLKLDYWVLQTLAMLVTAWLIPKLKVTSIFGAFTTVVAIAFMNTKVWDAALFFNIPDTLSVQAGSLLLANGVLFWVLVKLLPGIEVSGFLPALLAPLVFTVCSLAISAALPHIDWMAILEIVIDSLNQLKEYYQAMQNSDGFSAVSSAISDVPLPAEPYPVQ